MTVATSHNYNSKNQKSDITCPHINYMAMCC